jgi:glutathione S-transferase
LSMKLFYLPGSCALASHVALECSGLAYEAVRVERGAQTDPTYLAINPLGRVPALVTATHGTITEVPAVLSYIADVATGRALLPAMGKPERYEALRWMAYLSSTVHPAFGRLWRAERIADNAGCKSSVEHAAAAQLTNDFAHIEKQLSGRQWVAGDQLTAADFYLFVFGRWGLRLPTSTRGFPSFHRHTLAIASLAATKSAIAQQGITFEGPASGPG